MKILVADKLPPEGLAALESAGHEVVANPDLSADDLPQAVSESRAEILVVRSTKVKAPVFEADNRLSLVIRAGAGVNTIDLETASRKGIYVANCPGKNAIAVAELTMGLLLAHDRGIADAWGDLRGGQWNKKKYGKMAQGLYGRSMGIVGFGAIGRAVAERALAFGMEVHAFDRSLTEEQAEDADCFYAADLDELLATCDVVTLHVPKTLETTHLIGAAELAKMKPNAILIHTARGGVVDDVALAEALAAGKIRAALDVFEDEPAGGEAPFDNPLREAPNLLATPHIAASTAQAASAIAAEVGRIVDGFANHGVVYNSVNVIRDRPARFSLVVRHLDQVGVLANILARLRKEQLSVKEMQNIIFSGNHAASATITVEREPSPELLDLLRADEAILAVDLRAAKSS